MGILQARILEWIAVPSPGDLLNPGIEPRYLALQVDSLLSESPGKLEWVAFPSPGDLSDSGIELGSPALQVYTSPGELPQKPMTDSRSIHISTNDTISFLFMVD